MVIIGPLLSALFITALLQSIINSSRAKERRSIPLGSTFSSERRAHLPEASS